MVMGTVGFIEEKGQLNLGLGIPAGAATVLAAGKCLVLATAISHKVFNEPNFQRKLQSNSSFVPLITLHYNPLLNGNWTRRLKRGWEALNYCFGFVPGASIHTTRGFGGYRPSSCTPGTFLSRFRFLGPSVGAASALTCLWTTAFLLHVTLVILACHTILEDLWNELDVEYGLRCPFNQYSCNLTNG